MRFLYVGEQFFNVVLHVADSLVDRFDVFVAFPHYQSFEIFYLLSQKLDIVAAIVKFEKQLLKRLGILQLD